MDDHGLVVEPAARFMNVAESRTSAAVIDDDEMAGAEVGADEEAVWSPVWVQVHDQAQVGDNKSNWATVPTA